LSVWREVRRQARLWHAELAPDAQDLVPAKALIEAAEKQTGIRIEARPAQDALLDNAEAVYDPEARRIYYSAETDPALAAFHIAHEFAHHRIDSALARCLGGDIDVATPAEPELSLVGETDTYSPKERAEALANLFARELLLPRGKLRKVCAAGVFDAQRIADQVGVPPDLVMQQLADALLLPEEIEGSDDVVTEPPPDDSQRLAAEASLHPLKVRAGPGTGKTRTLVGRVEHLVKSGEAPHGIAVLTFSNFSAQDLSARIRAAVGAQATAIWTGTFHGFGLELLRKYGEAIGLPVEVRLADRSGSLLVLEGLLGELNLKHYLDLNEPLRKLRSVLALISRAKDELISPEDYEQHGQAMLARAGDAASRADADKALEVARAYRAYDAALRAQGAVDFGDLISLPVQLLRANPIIRDAVRTERPHILVDEFQDMNRASGLLLRELVSTGRGPWVVGDVRQAIYRFRGASPVNMERFADDFPGAETRDLAVNYRSGGRIVRTFESFGAQMTGAHSSSAGPLKAHRGEDKGRITLDVASTLRAEYQGIAQRILATVRSGGRFGNHAILARSHTTLARLARHLERAGVPCLYFGDFFERPEIRDLLSVMSLAAEPGGVALVRVGQQPHYSIPADDISRIVAWRRAQNISMPSAIKRWDEIEGLSGAAQQGLRRLREDLGHGDYMTSAYRFLLVHLFSHGAHLQPLFADQSVAGQQRRLAIYQLLQFAFSFRGRPGTDPKRAFLDHVRRLELLDEEKQLRQLPAAAGDIDAVRMMTVHAAKGLEFPIVHLPALTARHFPVNRPDLNPLPAGLIDTSALMSREAEEEALFFVAMSRARDTLHLSRAVNCGGRGWDKLGPSPFLERIRGHLPTRPDSPPTWGDEGLPEAVWAPLDPPQAREAWPAQALETYLECPRRFYYADVLGLGGLEARTPYRRFQSALRASIGWLRETTSEETRRQGAGARLAADWEEKGPREPGLSTLYRAAAERMLAMAMKLMSGTMLPTELSLTLRGDIVITSNADHVRSGGDGIVIQRLKAGALAAKEGRKARHVVAQAALQRKHPGLPVQFQHVSLEDGKTQDTTLNARKLDEELLKLGETFDSIRAGAFAPEPDDFRCPSCPYFFICPSHFPRSAP
jgi:superfamily I DNA/RNA helicase/Zn-dependent peptidase ImmA (M78 family)